MNLSPAVDAIAYMPAPALDRLLGIKDVVKATSLSMRTIDRKIAAGTFPKAIKTSSQRRAWKASSIVRWLAECEVRAA
jgi:prophage regulatory protein